MNKYTQTLKKLEQTTAKDNMILVLQGGIVGVLAGLTAVAYRYCLAYAETALGWILKTINHNYLWIGVWFIALILIGFLVSKIVRFEGMAAGSGIPQVTGEVRGYISPNWFRVIFAKFVGGTLCILGGLSLGREGPSIQLGAMAAKGFSRNRKYNKTKEIGLICCGAGGGLAAAFNAPLAGILFVLEEIHRTFDKTILVAGMVAAVVADFISKIFFGQQAIFSYDTATVPLRYYWLLAILGVILGLAGAGYNFVMMKGLYFVDSLKKVPKMIPICATLVLSGVLGLVLPEVLGGGHAMVSLLENSRPTLMMLTILLIVKFLFSATSFCSGVPGGIFFPLLVLGSYIGAIFGDVAIGLFPLNNGLWAQFIILGMAGLFASIVRAPITGIVLILEMSGNLHRLSDVAVVSIISYIVATLIGSKPIYTSLLDRILDKQKEIDIDKGAEKILVTYVVPFESPICNKKIRDIDWQKNTLVASIYREDHTITPKGDTEIFAGDQLMLLIGRQYYSEDNSMYEKMIYGN